MGKLGRSRGLTLPADMDPSDAAHLQDLERLAGEAFDEAYVEEALRINAEDKRDGEQERADVEDRAIKHFLDEFDDMDEERERLARKLEQTGG